MKYRLMKSFKKPYIYCKDNIVVEVNDEFTNLIGYSKEEMLGKEIKEVEEILKINSQIHLDDIIDEYSGYIFTKSLQAREVNIFLIQGNKKDEKIYTFVEKQNSRLDAKMIFIEEIFKENKISAAIYSVPNLILLRANQKYLDFLDFPFNEAKNRIGRTNREIIPGFEGSEPDVFFNKVLTSQSNCYVKELKADKTSKGLTYWDESLIPIFENGKLKYIFQTSIEVTERILKNKSLEIQEKINQQQKEKYEAIIENMSDEVVIFNKQGEYELINKAFRENLSYKDIEILNIDNISKNVSYFDKGNPIGIDRYPSTRVLNGENFSGCILETRNSYGTTYREVSGTPIYDSDGNFLAGVVVNRDISKRIKDEENKLMKKQYNLLNGIIENLNLGYMRVSYPDFKIKYFNKQVYNNLNELNNKVNSAIIGSNIFELFMYSTEETYIISMKIKDLLNKKVGTCFYNKRHILNGEERFFKVMVQEPLHNTNNVKELIIITIDITEEIQAKSKIEKALKLQEEVFANVTHELKTPINLIFSTNQLMELYLKDDLANIEKEKLIRNVSVIKQNCYRSVRLINNIMDMSKIEGGYFNLNLSNENIVQVVEDITQSVSEYINRKGLNIIFDTNVEEKIIACDPEKIERIMLNLISNAIKFSKTEGSIFIDIIDKGDIVEILVKDTGFGIKNKHLNNIFRRYYQVDKSISRNTEGTGIGLTLVKSIVELHGGKIDVESKIGQGSIFKIQLPSKTIDEYSTTKPKMPTQSKIEMINIEFSDIYSF